MAVKYTGLLEPLASRRPLLAGAVAAPLYGAVMMLIADIVTAFRHPVMMAILWGVAGVLFGIAMAWYWSRAKRSGDLASAA
jgi:hypothetical protein